MRLKKVTLRNFRCFEELEIDLHPRLTVFVGENGAGKTAVLDGIACGLSPILNYLSSANQRLTGRGLKDSDIRVVLWPQLGGATRWGKANHAQIQVETFDGPVWATSRTSGPERKSSNSIGQTGLKQHLQPIADSYATAQPLLTPVTAYYGAQRGYIQVPRRLHSAKQNYRHPAAALIGALDSMSDFREMLAWFDQEEVSELRENKGASGENFTEFPTLTAVRSAIEEVLGGAYSNPHFSRDHKFVLTRQSDGAHLLVNQLSQGYQSMLALAMDFSRRLAIANPHAVYAGEGTWPQIFEAITELEELDDQFSRLAGEDATTALRPALALSAPAIMLVDEIDLHLHPTWQQRVLNDLMRTFPLTQFIVTTHSPQILTTVARKNIRVLYQGDDGAMFAKTPEFSPLAHESGDALAKIMGTHREPEIPLQDDIRRYEQLVRSGAEEGEGARQLRRTLGEAGYQFHESDLVTWRFLASHKANTKGAS